MPNKNITHGFKFTPVVSKGLLSETDESTEDTQYWLTRPVQERIAAVTFLVFQSLEKGKRIDKSVVTKKKLKTHDPR